MKFVRQSWEWINKPIDPLKIIELGGRTCYKSEEKITDSSAAKFVNMLLKSGHHSVIEHTNASVRFITNRGVTHELVRHRLASYSQESTRYVNYGTDSITFIYPVWVDQAFLSDYYFYTQSGISSETNTAKFLAWERFSQSCYHSEQSYKELLEYGWRPEQAREILPNALKTEIVMTANLREWRHVFNLRCSGKAHPQIRELMRDTLTGFKKAIPILFDDLYPEEI